MADGGNERNALRNHAGQRRSAARQASGRCYRHVEFKQCRSAFWAAFSGLSEGHRYDFAACLI
jgi:hypothetical protein